MFDAYLEKRCRIQRIIHWIGRNWIVQVMATGSLDGKPFRSATSFSSACTPSQVSCSNWCETVAALRAPTGAAIPNSSTLRGEGASHNQPPVFASVIARDLKAHLTSWLNLVQAAEVVEVLSHSNPFARITAVRQLTPSSTNPLQKAIDADIDPGNGPGLVGSSPGLQQLKRPQ
jgi:antitoxin (DNA-binding transcriptional repressor) of toxin-antitoxin stability system